MVLLAVYQNCKSIIFERILLVRNEKDFFFFFYNSYFCVIAIGVQYDEVKTKIPISLKCHPHQNIYFSVISGPLEILETFVERHNYKCATKTYEDRYVPVNSHVIFEFSDILNQVCIYNILYGFGFFELRNELLIIEIF